MRVLSMRLGEGYAGMYCTLSNLELVLRHSEKKKHLLRLSWFLPTSHAKVRPIRMSSPGQRKMQSVSVALAVLMLADSPSFTITQSHTRVFRELFGNCVHFFAMFPCALSFGTAQVECIAEPEGKLNGPRSDLTCNSHWLDGIATWIPLLHCFACVDPYLCPKEAKGLTAEPLVTRHGLS